MENAAGCAGDANVYRVEIGWGVPDNSGHRCRKRRPDRPDDCSCAHDGDNEASHQESQTSTSVHDQAHYIGPDRGIPRLPA